MYKTMIAGVAGALLAGSAMASEPVKLTDGQMDDVVAGFRLAAGLGFGTGASVLTVGLGTGSSSLTTGGGGGFSDTLQITTGGSLLQSTGIAEGLAVSATTYSSLLGGASSTGAVGSGGIVIIVP